jgi:Histidine kinase-, DNA gyrase B-, and HSP90-like ATPase.
MGQVIVRDYDIPADDFLSAGEASSAVRNLLIQLGIAPDRIKRTAIAMYEAEINAVIHGHGGKAHVEIKSDRITIVISDEGPGIEDLELAMQEGYSTAPDSIREMGFGAGMGLPNMKKNADELVIDTAKGKGTVVTITVYL